MALASTSQPSALSGWLASPVGEEVKREADTTGQFMASGGAATAIIMGIGKLFSMKMSLGVGLTLGFGLGPVLYLGTLGVNALFMKLFEVTCPEKYQKWERYLQEIKKLRQVKVRHPDFSKTKEAIKQLKAANRDVAWLQSTFCLVALIGVAVSLFFFINGVIGSLGILPFMGAIAIACVLILFIPKPSEMGAYCRKSRSVIPLV